MGNALISESKNESLEPKVINHANSSGVMQKTEEFYPLTEEDAEWLRLRSDRDFNLRFMNKLLLKLADNKPNNRFSTKEKLLNYMAKALINEKRDTVTVNSEDFSFEYDHKTKIQAVYGAKKVKHLKVIYTSAAKPIVKQEQEVSIESYIETALVGLDDIWRKVRECLIYSCGKMVDIAWFSKLELVTKDEINNKIFLKPKTAFIGSRITADYFFT